MKKSEKIEVRLSHEEKQKLTEIADGEGRSVSELVRGLISRYMAVNAPIVKKTAWGKIAAVAVVGVLLGHLGTWGLMRGHGGDVEVEGVPPEVFEFIVEVRDTKEKRDYTLTTPIAVIDGDKQSFSLIGPQREFSVSTLINETGNTLPKIIASICEVSSKTCVPVAKQTLLMDFQTKSKSHANPDESTAVSFTVCAPSQKHCF